MMKKPTQSSPCSEATPYAVRLNAPLMNSKSQQERRRFLHFATAILATPLLSPEVRHAAHELLIGKAYAADQNGLPAINFIEINLRDQWDFGHAFVPPGIASHNGEIGIGESGRRLPLYCRRNQITSEVGNYWLTPDAAELRPHLDTIATCELYELTSGPIHGHEAANAIRSPGRSQASGGSRSQMWLNDGGGEQGNEYHWSSSPTPAALHNHWMHQINPSVRNAAAFKTMIKFHTVYHHSAGLSQAQPDRLQSREAILNAFKSLGNNASQQIMPSRKEADELIANLKRIDSRFIAKYGFRESGQFSYLDVIQGSSKNLFDSSSVTTNALALTAEEQAYWNAGIPDNGNNRALVGELAAWSTKLITSGVLRTVAYEWLLDDLHDARPSGQIVNMARQFALPLARMITQLKAAGVYDNTVIMVNSLDGGRTPHAESSGDEGKNTMILAGGRIKGGYFGDIRLSPIQDGINKTVYYHRPEANGTPTNSPVENRDGGNRVPGRDGWRTLMKALNIPDALAASFPDTQAGVVQSYMLRV